MMVRVRLSGFANSAYVSTARATRYAAIGGALFTVRKEVVSYRLLIGVERKCSKLAPLRAAEQVSESAVEREF
jgi:hypothetical protein